MNPVVHFEEVRRGDAGRDGGGIYRNIARETRIPNILTKGKYSTLDWPEICRLFSSKATEERVQVPISYAALSCSLYNSSSLGLSRRYSGD
jgi:hypothetical protein